MARVDIPVLECDRCKSKTTNRDDMANWYRLIRVDISKDQEIDLCRVCFPKFLAFMGGEELPAESYTTTVPEVHYTPIE